MRYDGSVSEPQGTYLEHSHVCLLKVKVEAGDESLHVVPCVLFSERWLEGHNHQPDILLLLQTH